MTTWIVWLAGCLVPAVDRTGWRRDWRAELWHYEDRLRDRRIGELDIRLRVWRMVGGAWVDAWTMRRDAEWFPRTRSVLARLTRPAASILGLLGIGWLLVLALSDGLNRTRGMWEQQEQDLYLVSEIGLMMAKRYPVPPGLLARWEQHSQTVEAFGGFRWNDRGSTGWYSPGFERILGGLPHHFLAREVNEWRLLDPAENLGLGVVVRLRPGVSREQAERELRVWEKGSIHRPTAFPFPEASLTPLGERVVQPWLLYGSMSALGSLSLLGWGVWGFVSTWRRTGHWHLRHAGYLAAKAVLFPGLAFFAVVELSPATAFSVTGGLTIVRELATTWSFLVTMGLFSYWCIRDQHTRCRACLRPLVLPVRIGAPGAVLFDHAGIETVCCEGHGVLYDPEQGSEYVQAGGWTALDVS